MRTRTEPAWATDHRISPSCGTWHSTSCRRMARRRCCAASFSGPDGTTPISPASWLYSEVQLPWIFLFGFSRGAFTARSIAGLIGAIGLLHPTEMGRFMDAWRWAQLPANQRDINDLNKCFPRRTRDVPIRCIGVWDTVGALGVPRNRLLKGWHPCAEPFRFYDTSRGSHVEHAFQALAIDERREPFEPVLWTAPRNPLEKQVICQVWF